MLCLRSRADQLLLRLSLSLPNAQV
uniref:Uncharacterized protein n=1 Tax=Arundo donax TaxID=35708 RepID=A0A0A8ZEK0_ARUDO